MKKRSFHYKKILGISLALALFLGGIGIVQNILDERTQILKMKLLSKWMKIRQKKTKLKKRK